MVCGDLGRLVRKRLGTDSELLSSFYLLVTTVAVRELNRVKYFFQVTVPLMDIALRCLSFNSKRHEECFVLVSPHSDRIISK